MALSPATLKLLGRLEIAWIVVSLILVFYCAWLGLNAPGHPEPDAGRIYPIEFKVRRSYVTFPEAVAFWIGMGNLAVFVIWTLFSRWRERRQRAAA